ncbi:MAG: hypothetical protein ACJ8EH_06150, partial [Sphingomicrobium sp.]
GNVRLLHQNAWVSRGASVEAITVMRGSGQKRAAGAGVTVLDEVRAFVGRLAPDPVCDDCIADRLNLPVRKEANHKSRELAGHSGFKREKAYCSLCGTRKLVIRKS